MFKKARKRVTLTGRLTAAVMLGLLVAFSTYPAAQRAIAAATCSSTADCQAQISSTNSSIANSQAELSTLASQAGTYQQAIAALQSQISGLQSQIDANEAQQAALQTKITAEQAQLDQEKSVLANVVRTTYIDGQMTTIEALATSQNLSDYVDKEADYQQVEISIQDSMNKIAALQSQLNTQKQSVDNLLATQQTQQNQLQAARAQQDSMLNYTESQQASYNSQLATSKSNLSALQARLAALNSAGSVSYSGTCGGGYPSSASNGRGGTWGCNYAQDNTTDNWYMLNRECVSYTAWMAHQTFGINTSHWGNAYQWITAAENAGYRVDQTPAVNTIAIRDIDYSEPGDVGHAMWVTGVSGSNITVSEYNEHYTGTYDQRTFNVDAYDNRGGLYFIHLN